nr:dual specificity protein kinase pom1 [Quercus suber]
MDTATRYPTRGRAAATYLDRTHERSESGSSRPTDDSGAESDSVNRRKFQRAHADENNEGFRRPMLPASVTRGHPQPPLANRRRSTLRENVRVPSGPREYPSPGKRLSSIAASGPSILDSTNVTFNPPKHRTIVQENHSPAEDRFDFLPTVNFDDFQNSLSTPSYDTSAPLSNVLLSDFPLVPGRLTAPTENDKDKKSCDSLGGSEYVSSKPALLRQSGAGDKSIDRGESFRKRLSVAPAVRQSSNQYESSKAPIPSTPQSNLSLRSRRQSSVPLAVLGPEKPASRPPRKSVGPGLITNVLESRKPGPISTSPSDGTSHANGERSSGLSKRTRRSTLQPSASAGADLPRLSTLQATTQSRANKVKNAQPVVRDPNTPLAHPVSKGSSSRSHTPSSSGGNRRQSTVTNGRASGLGARTVSPTDARRFQRLSMMQVPPIPTNLPRGPPTPAEEARNPWALRPEQSRLAQPSPSLIPRKTQSISPTSARQSPEPAFALSTKSSLSSSSNGAASTSRLPTLKSRNLHSSSAQYGEPEELVPPVPAIPKAYGSPKDYEKDFFPPNAAKSSQSAFESHSDLSGDFDFDRSFLLAPMIPVDSSRSSMDTSRDMTRTSSGGDHAYGHKRTLTTGSTKASGSGVEAPGRTPKYQPDATGRKNNNLQPLRLPPLNLMPINSTTSRAGTGFPRPSQELENRYQDHASLQTPEPRRTAKTPSTPMTASKATFHRRQDEEFAKPKDVRSSSSHYALRDVMQYDDAGVVARFFDDNDTRLTMGRVGAGISIPNSKQRSTITPFASGSLPKSSGDLAKSRGDGYETDDHDSTSENADLKSGTPHQTRPRTMTTTSASRPPGTSSTTTDSPVIERPPQQLPDAPRKEASNGGLRRKLSLGWRRSTSKASQHHEKQSSPQQTHEPLLSAKKNEDRDIETKRIAKRASEMPPPRIPASSNHNSSIRSSNDAGVISTDGARPSFDRGPRKSVVNASRNTSDVTLTDVDGIKSAASATPTVGVTGANAKNMHPEPSHPTPGAGNRSSSWGNFGLHTGGQTRPSAISSRSQTVASTVAKHRSTPSNVSAIVKDKDDLTADDEMRRLSQKRRDVDAAARESEALKARAVARTPLRPSQILHDRNFSLNIFERGEVVDYEKDGIFFTGTKAAKKIIGSVAALPSSIEHQFSSDSKAAGGNNFGYDDERGDYNIVLGDHLAYRYEVIDMLGKGSFGQVVRCIDHMAGCVVAVKIIRNKKRFHQQALVEDPDGANATLSITSSFYFRSHLCIVTPCLSINLYELIRAHNFVGFSLPLVRRFSRQLLACLVLLQRKRIIHCDLKPENILLCEARKADVRVIDFGSSCREEEKVYTYIQSRFYRSPEVILGSSYGLGIDMWSLGCILAELWTGYPIFPGENEQEQLACIMEIFGPPDRHLVERCTRKKLFFDSVGKPRVTVSSKGRRRRPSSKTLAQALKSDDEAFLDFVSRCLRWDPERRIKPAEAINHPFITNLPLHQRSGIPEEARRAPKLRTTAVPATTNGTNPSPTKRTSAAVTQQSTPVRDRLIRDQPQTVLRSTTIAGAGGMVGSPRKTSLATDPSRRHSAVATAGGIAALAGNKRASNGAALGGGNLAQLAASGAMAAGPGSQRDQNRGRI